MAVEEEQKKELDTERKVVMTEVYVSEVTAEANFYACSVADGPALETLMEGLRCGLLPPPLLLPVPLTSPPLLPLSSHAIPSPGLNSRRTLPWPAPTPPRRVSLHLFLILLLCSSSYSASNPPPHPLPARRHLRG